MSDFKEIILGISGASGAVYGIRLLEILRELNVKTHLIITKPAQITIAQETDYTLDDVKKLSFKFHGSNDIAACISSGSYKTIGMIVAPCSVKSVAEIANGLGGNLLSRSADVMLKERRKLVLMVRETPLHSVHLRNMLTLSEMGAIIAPPAPAFYNNPQSLDDIVNHNVGRMLDLFDLDSDVVKRWKGL